MTFRYTILTLVLSLILATPAFAQGKKPGSTVKGPHGAFADSPEKILNPIATGLHDIAAR